MFSFASIRSGTGRSAAWRAKLSEIQNDAIAKSASSHPDRFVGLASVDCNFPNWRRTSWNRNGKAGYARLPDRRSVNGEDFPLKSFIPSGTGRAIAAVVLSTRQGFLEAQKRLQGNGYLTNVIGQTFRDDSGAFALNFEGTWTDSNSRFCAPMPGDFFRPTVAGWMLV